MNKIYSVSGSPRSGTSLMMNILVNTFGEERLIGEKFPQENKKVQKSENESDEHFQIRKYNFYKLNPDFDKELEEIKKLNPLGFYEHPFVTVKGLNYDPLKNNVIKRINNSNEKLFLKIESRGIINTNPIYIDKVIYMLRNPHQVAKSQERMSRDFKYKMIDNSEIDLFSDDKNFNSPELFIQSQINFANWVLDNDFENYIIIEYDELIQNKNETLNNIQNFLNEGDFSKSENIINPRFKRSNKFDNEKSEDKELWKDAEKAYQLVYENKLKELIDYFENKKLEFNKKNQNWLCPRFGEYVNYKTCQNCKNNKEFRESLKEHANKKGIDWENEPCAFECGYDENNKPISIKKSIENNFWNSNK